MLVAVWLNVPAAVRHLQESFVTFSRTMDGMAGAPDLVVRRGTPKERQLAAEIHNRCNPDQPQLTAEMIASAVERSDPARPVFELVAERGGMPVGVGLVRGVPIRAGLFTWVDVEPPARRQGIGTAMFEAILEGIGPEPHLLWTFASTTQQASLAFIARHGFRERDRFFESELDLGGFDPDAYAAERQGALDRGLRFTTVAAEDSPELRRRVHLLADAVDRDIPSVDRFQPVTHEQWLQDWFASPGARPDLMVLVMDGDEPVALSTVTWPQGTAPVNGLTGVLPAYRGHGLATAVKVEALRRARAAGATAIRTDNHARNAPMLAINERLGYRRKPAYIDFVREPVA